MTIEYQINDVILKNVTSFSVEQTLECGQCFRWEKINANTYRGIAYGKILTISQSGDTVIFHNCTKKDFENTWYHYFDLETDYDSIRKEIAPIHPLLNEIQQYASGIRILKQESWEALCSFILSQNNNIPRIKGIIKRLCENFGEEIELGQYAFPSAEKLSRYTVDEFAVLRSGFRAKYIFDACNKIADREINLEKISKMSVEQARTELIKIRGVGRKVADCTMLYGMGKKECFPVDVWIKRAMEVLFPEFTYDSFGKNAGIVQQYIYHYSRMNSELFNQFSAEYPNF